MQEKIVKPLEKIVEQLEKFNQLKNPRAAITTSSSVLSYIAHVNDAQLLALTEAELVLFLSCWFSNQLNWFTQLNRPSTFEWKAKNCEDARDIIERYIKIKNSDAMIELLKQINNRLGDLKRSSEAMQNKSVPFVDEQETIRQVSALKDFLDTLKRIENQNKVNQQELAEQCQRINGAANTFYDKVANYWLSQSEVHEELIAGMRQNTESFRQSYMELVERAKKLCAMGMYHSARQLLCFKGTTKQEPNRAQDFPLSQLLENLIILNEVALKNEPKKLLWQQQRERFRQLSADVKAQLLSGVSIEIIQAKITHTDLQILNEMLDCTTLLLGKPPAKYCLIGFGSLERGDANLESDADAAYLSEQAILTDTKSVIYNRLQRYKQSQLQLLRYQCTLIENADGKTHGFHYDTGSVTVSLLNKNHNKNALKGTLIEQQHDTDKFNTKHDYSVEGYCNDVLNPGDESHVDDWFGRDNTKIRPVKLYGYDEIFLACRKKLANIATFEKLKPVFEKTRDDLLAGFEGTAGVAANDFKTRYLHPLIWAITQLGLLHNLPQDHSNHPLEIIRWLSKQGKLHAKFVDDCIEYLQLLYKRRLEKQLGIKQDLSADEEKTLKERVIEPMHRLFDWLVNDKDSAMMPQINPYTCPDKAGHRLSVQFQQEKWQASLKATLLDNKAAKGLPEIKIKTTTIGTGWLNPEIIKQLIRKNKLTDKGAFNFEATEDRHLNIDIEIDGVAYYLKVFSEMPGMEYTAGSLARLATGGGMPFVEMTHLELNGKAYPVLISQTVKGETDVRGETLDKILKKPEVLKKILSDKPKFSARMLMTLLQNPEDQKPNNLVSLESVDNDRSFYPAAIDENSKVTIIVKSIIYCMDEMLEKFDASVRAEFISLDPFQVLESWLTDLAQADSEFRKLFSEKEIKEFFKEKNLGAMLKKMGSSTEMQKETIVPIPIKEKMVTELYLKIVRIQAALRENPDITHLNLLKKIEPTLGNYYGDLLKEKMSVTDRFDKGPGQFYIKGRKETHVTQGVLPETLKTLQGKPVEIKELIARKDYYAKQAKEELNAVHDQYSKVQIYVEYFMQGKDKAIDEFKRLNDGIKEQVINQLDFSKLNATVQAAILKAITGVSFRRLRLRNCTALDNDALTVILKKSPELTSLDVSGCHLLSAGAAVGGDFIRDVAGYCKILKKLDASGLPKLVSVSSLLGGELKLMKLKKLYVNGCANLKGINALAPELEDLRVKNCSALVEADVKSKKLEKVDFSGCKYLTDKGLGKLVKGCSALEGLNLAGCDKVTDRSRREINPYGAELGIMTLEQLRKTADRLYEHSRLDEALFCYKLLLEKGTTDRFYVCIKISEICLAQNNYSDALDYCYSEVYKDNPLYVSGIIQMGRIESVYYYQ